MLPFRFDADPTIEAEWLAIESRLEKLETGIREWRISLGLPGTEPRQASRETDIALLPVHDELPCGDAAIRDRGIALGFPATAASQDLTDAGIAVAPCSDGEPRREDALPDVLAPVASALRSALTTISTLMDRAAQITLNARQIEELRESVEVVARWPRKDPAFTQARTVSSGVWTSGVLILPSQRPTFPEQVLSECHLLLGYLDRWPD